MRASRNVSNLAPEACKDAAQAHIVRPPARSTLGPAATFPPSTAGGIFKSAAVEVLRVERRLMSTGDITRIAVQRGFLKAQGKTPEASMASALYTDVKKKSGASLFTRPQEGLFGLREWMEEGFFPEGFWAGGGPSLEFAESGVPVAANAAYKRSNKARHRITHVDADGQVLSTTVSGSRVAEDSGSEEGSSPREEPQQPGLSVGATPAGRPPLPPSAKRRGLEKQQGRGRGRGDRRRSADQGNGERGSALDGAGEGDGGTAGPDNSNSALFLLGEAALVSTDGGDGVAGAGNGTAAAHGAGGDDGLQPAAGALAVRRLLPRRRPAALEVGDNDTELADDGGKEAGRPAAAPANGKADAGGSCCTIGPPAAATVPAAAKGPRLTLEVLPSPLPYAPGSFVEDELIRSRQPRKRKPLSVTIPNGGGSGEGPRSTGADAAGAEGATDKAGHAAAELLGRLSAAPSRDPMLIAGGDAGPIIGMPGAPLMLPPQQQLPALTGALAGVDWGALQLNLRQQWPAGMGYQQAGLFSPTAGLLDATSIAPTPISSIPAWDPGMAATAVPTVLNQIPHSLGLLAPALQPLPGFSSGGHPASAAGVAGISMRPAGGPVVLELASPRDTPERRPAKRGRTATGAAPGVALAVAPAVQLPLGMPPPLSPRAVEDLARLDQWQATIEAAERALGRDHPAVGRAWMDLAKALQSVALHSDRARMATKRAFDIVLAAARGGPAREGFRYLLGRGQQQPQQGQQQGQQQAGVGAGQQQGVGTTVPEPPAGSAGPQHQMQPHNGGGGKENSPGKGEGGKPAGGGGVGEYQQGVAGS